MTVLTEATKAKRITQALSKQEADYMVSGDAAEKMCARTIHRGQLRPAGLREGEAV